MVDLDKKLTHPIAWVYSGKNEGSFDHDTRHVLLSRNCRSSRVAASNSCLDLDMVRSGDNDECHEIKYVGYSPRSA